MRFPRFHLTDDKRPFGRRRAHPAKKLRRQPSFYQVESLEGRLMLAGPDDDNLRDLVLFASTEALEDVLLQESLERWDHLFGRPAPVCRQQWWQPGVATPGPALRAGDADQDFDFDQLDLVQVQIAGKYLTEQHALWGEGDWNCAPGGSPGSPPPGDGRFNQLDIIAALNTATYLTAGYGDGGPGFSSTNTQVAGVDEADFVETDGDYLYTLSGQQLVIADSWPHEELSVVSRVNLPGQPFAQYLNGDRLTVLSHGVEQVDTSSPFLVRPFGSRANTPGEESRPGINVTVLDVTDRAQPSVIQRIAMHGSYVDSRAIGDHVYVVTSDRFGLAAPEVQCVSPEDAKGRAVRCQYETRQQFVDRVEGETLRLGLPNFSVFGPDGQLARQGLLSDLDTIYQPTAREHENLLSVVVFDTKSESPGPASFVNVPTSGATIMYASTQSVYLLDPNVGADQWANEGQETSIVRFDLDSSHGQVSLGAVGAVPGRVLNSFSVDEYDGRFRLATTEGSWRDTINRVFVLDDQLQTVGQTGNSEMAPGERIFSVRFAGNRGYVVTFPEVGRIFRDPLFTIDLANPTRDPQVLGELEIPGFSNYLHPVQDDYLIGLGRDADERTGRIGQLQVSLFDVSDPARPALADRFDFEVPGWAQTEAIGDHHALAYYPEHQILTVPVTSGGGRTLVDRDGDGRNYIETFRPRTDLWIFQIDPLAHTDGDQQTRAIELLGRIQHHSDVRRTVRIEDVLYSLSETTIEAHELLDPEHQLNSLYIGHEDVGVSVFDADLENPSVRTALQTPEQAAPQVIDVRVSSTEWSPVFVDFLGHGMPSAAKLEPGGVLSFAGLNQIKVTFSEDVLVGRQDLSVQGTSGKRYATSNFTYSPGSTTAVWTFRDRLEADTVSLELSGIVDLGRNPLDGNANGHAGDVFSYQVSLLAGDLNQDGKVDFGDSTLARDHQVAAIGEATYDLFADIDGSGDVGDLDYAEVRERWGTSLPGIAPPILGDGNGDGRFDTLDLVLALQSGKFLTSSPASLADGDWNADEVFDELDLVIALQEGHFLPSA